MYLQIAPGLAPRKRNRPNAFAIFTPQRDLLVVSRTGHYKICNKIHSNLTRYKYKLIKFDGEQIKLVSTVLGHLNYEGKRGKLSYWCGSIWHSWLEIQGRGSSLGRRGRRSPRRRRRASRCRYRTWPAAMQTDPRSSSLASWFGDRCPSSDDRSLDRLLRERESESTVIVNIFLYFWNFKKERERGFNSAGGGLETSNCAPNVTLRAPLPMVKWFTTGRNGAH